VRAVKLLACRWDRNKHPHPPIPVHAYKLLFRCELLGGVGTGNTETAEVGFFAADHLTRGRELGIRAGAGRLQSTGCGGTAKYIFDRGITTISTPDIQRLPRRSRYCPMKP
jgi:hypothetical protein